MTRMGDGGSLKKLLKRAARVVTHRQTDFNKATTAVLEDLIARTDEMMAESSALRELFDRREYPERDPNIALIRSDIADIQQQLRALQRGLSWPAQSEPLPAISATGPGEARSELRSTELRSEQRSTEPGGQSVAPVLNVFGDWA